ncbi:MAG: hypothetical protein SOZ62_01605 [Eubacteriales bacterium]|nr:hypothetical protein [Eubacteriales bacterium]
MYRYMYMGYNKGEITVKECDEVYYSVVSCYKEKVFVYLETRVKDLDPETVVLGDLIGFPDGKKLIRMEKIFHCDPFDNDDILVIPPKERKPIVSLMILNHDAPVLAYIGHHYVLQEDGKTVWNRYYSIYEIQNILVSVSDEQQIAAPSRKSPFAVDVSSVVDATRPVINDNIIPWDDGAPMGWRVINK